MPSRLSRFIADDDEFDFEQPRKDDWNEEDHPRGPDGKFGGGSSSPAAPHAPPTAGHRVFTDTPPAGLSGKQTIEEHYKNGEPTPERKASVHDPIVRAAVDGVQAPGLGEPKVAYFTMGGPGSGKSASLRNVDTSKYVKVDPDAIKEKLPEYQQAIADRNATYSHAAAMVHEEASDVAKRIYLESLAAGKHVLVDGTGVSAESLARKMDVAKAAGYHVHLAFTHLDDVNEAQRRIDSRADATGRTVPREYVEKAYKAIPRNFANIAKHADSFEVHDSSKRDSPTVWSKTPEAEHIVDPEFVRNFKEKYQSGRTDGDWNEDDHPRGPDGKFGGGGATSSTDLSVAPRAASPQEFKAAFERAFKDNTRSAFVSHYTDAELAGMKTFLSADGKAGIAVHDHGDGRIEGTALFNNGSSKGAGIAMLQHAVKEGGVNYLECFGEHLRGAYEAAGFKVDTKSPFNREYAPSNWNYERDGEPNYYTLRR